MTAKELIEDLQKLDPDTIVLINSNVGKTPNENISMIVVDKLNNLCLLRNRTR